MSEPEAKTGDDKPRSRARRWLSRWWMLYLPLLAASFIFQMGEGKLGPVPDGYQSADLPTQRSDGPVETNTAVPRSYISNTVAVRYQVAGPADGQPVILLHGSPGSSRDFTAVDNGLLKTLADQGYRVIAPDLPGFGDSQRYVPDYSNRAHARYVIELMQHEGIESAHILGFSMGGGVAIQLYDLAPDKVRSITMLAAIGVQEAEGSGDYTFEHLKYGVGYLLFVGGAELVPHFGALGPRSFRHAFLRNFWDTDQRPNHAILERYSLDAKPMLIIHGEADPLAPVRVAYAHHALVENSEMVIYAKDEFKSSFLNHAMVFKKQSNQLAIDALLPFLEKHRNPDAPATRVTDDHSEGMKSQTLQLPGNLELQQSMSVWTRIGVIMLGTFILEDPTSIAVGLFIKAGQLDLFVGAFALLAGIFLGDLGLYLIGYFVGRRALAWGPVAAWVPSRHVEKLGAWFDRRGWKAVVASRFIPGSRMPLYIAAGVTGNKPWRFMAWTFLAVCIWAPVILISVFLLGEAARSPFQLILNIGGWPAFIGVVIVLMFVMNAAISLFSSEGRCRLSIRIQKQWKYEYWPAWKFYPPVVIHCLWLALKYRSLTLWTLANPCMPDGGVVGESKCDILSRTDDPAVLKHARIDDGEAEARIKQVRQIIAQRGWSYPLILKPDAAQRGASVTLLKTDEDIAGFFEKCTGPAQLQQYHPGPLECGVFYTRLPSQPEGKIFSITDKVFPVLTGDGRSTLEQLIWQHPRFRFQHDVFHVRWADELERVLAEGETLRLAEAGNHCQGTLFRDGSRLITPELEKRIDQLAQRLDGYYFGRIDIRYSDEESFKRGENFGVIEFNGVTSESTNLYDPSWSLWRAYAVLRRQWALCFAIALEVKTLRGLRPKRPLHLLMDVIRYYRGRHLSTVSD